MAVNRRQGDRLHRLAADDRGSSLVETMVVLTLTTLILAAVSTTMIMGLRQSGGNQIRLENSGQTRVAMAAVTKNLRTAVQPSQLQLDGQTCTGCDVNAITNADANSITFYANVNNDLSAGGSGIGPSKVSYSIVQDPQRGWGNLQETVQPPTAAGSGQYTFCTVGAPGCVVHTREVARGLPWPTTGAVFTYYDALGAEFTALPLSAADQALVGSMDVRISVQTSDNYGTPPTTLLTRVTLSNSDVASVATTPTTP